MCCHKFLWIRRFVFLQGKNVNIHFWLSCSKSSCLVFFPNPVLITFQTLWQCDSSKASSCWRSRAGRSRGWSFEKYCQTHNGPMGWVLLYKHIQQAINKLTLSCDKQFKSVAKLWKWCFQAVVKLSAVAIAILPNASICIILNISNINNFWVSIFISQGHINQVPKALVSYWQEVMIRLGLDKNLFQCLFAGWSHVERYQRKLHGIVEAEVTLLIEIIFSLTSFSRSCF